MPMSLEDYMKLPLNRGRDTSDPRLKRRLGARVIINPEYADDLGGMISKPSKKNRDVAMNITRTEEQIGVTKHGHPIMKYDR